MNKKLSIIIPSYNEEKDIDRIGENMNHFEFQERIGGHWIYAKGL